MSRRPISPIEQRAILFASDDIFERITELSLSDAAQALAVTCAKLLFTRAQGHTEEQARATLANFVEVAIDHYKSMTGENPTRQ